GAFPAAGRSGLWRPATALAYLAGVLRGAGALASAAVAGGNVSLHVAVASRAGFGRPQWSLRRRRAGAVVHLHPPGRGAARAVRRQRLWWRRHVSQCPAAWRGRHRRAECACRPAFDQGPWPALRRVSRGRPGLSQPGVRCRQREPATQPYRLGRRSGRAPEEPRKM
ncbi:Chemotaxis protein CheD, partial [Pseudomonas sp. FEN]